MIRGRPPDKEIRSPGQTEGRTMSPLPYELRDEAYRLYQAGDPAAAASLCERLLRQEPRHAEAHYLLGVIAQDAGRLVQAAERIGLAAHLAPDNAVFVNALGEVSLLSDRQAEAEACFRRALTLRPAYERAHNNLGRLLHARGDLTAAGRCFAEALRLNPNYATAHNNLGAVLQARGEQDAAAAHFRQALALQPAYPEAHCNLGNTLLAQGDPPLAAARFREALRLRPGYARAQHGLGRALENLCDYHAALSCYRSAVQLHPGFVEAHESLGNLLLLQPDWEGARTAFERVLALRPDHGDAACRLAFTRQVLCDWGGRDADLVRVRRDADCSLSAGQATPVLPFCALTLPWPAEQHLAVARSHAEATTRGVAPLRQTLAFRPGPPGPPEGRLRVGYLSGEFRDHAVSHLVQGVFGRHDRRQFEVFAYSFGPDDGSTYRRRIVRDCDHFRDLRTTSLVDSARRVHDDQLHVLVDLQGWVGIPRMSLLALRPAPVQVHYLGYPGSTGADFIDYLIGDPVVTPPPRHAAYGERLVLLPHCYLATDNGQAVADSAGSRADHGLPAEAVVFCVFNNSYKIEPERFGVWMRILGRVPGSVLWLSPVAPVIEFNLRREAGKRGIAAGRLVFARRVADKADHLARHRLADLFLDTATYNGHTTACDALWAGLPLLTCPGDTFASRVGASLLTAVGLPELIAADEKEYEEMAVRLAGQPEARHQLGRKLAEQRTTWPLFDTPRLVRNLERAYRAMWDVYASGRPPQPLVVTDGGGPGTT
jgi:predicted O-linked N-acetylglucosamine transferase (SPINDLY family)